MDSEEKKYKSHKDLNERSIEEWARELDECPKRELTSELDIVGKFFYFTRRWLPKLC